MTWAIENKKGFMDKRSVAYQLVKSDPNQLPLHKLDLVLYYIKTPELLRDMAKIGFHESWYPFFEENGYLDHIFNERAQLANHELALANNFIDIFIEDPIKWMLKLENRRSKLNPQLFTLFCHKYDKDNLVIDKLILRQILEFFKPVIQYYHVDNYKYHLDRLISDLISFELYDDAMWILFQILDIEIRITTSFSYKWNELKGIHSDDKPELEGKAEFKSQSGDYIFKKYLNKYYLPLTDKIGYQLLYHFTYILNDVLSSLNRLKRNRYTYIHRPTIEASKDHYSHEALDFCLDTICKILDNLLTESPECAVLIYRLWSKIKEPFFKRLTLYAINKLINMNYAKS